VSQAENSSVNPGTPGQLAVYAGNGTSLNGISTVPVSAGGTGSATGAGALQNLGGISAREISAQVMSGPLSLSESYDSNTTDLNQAATAANVQNVAPRSVKEFGALGNGIMSDFVMTAGSHTVQLADVCCGYNFTPSVVGYLISIPKVDADHGTLYTTITGYTDATHVTVADAATYSFDGTGTFVNQALWMKDDSASIAAAISAVTSGRTAGFGATREGGGSVFVPCGYYGLSAQLSIPSGVRFEGSSSGCAVLMYMGTGTVDAAVEVSPGAGSSWLRNGLYFNPSYTNHAEIGACSGSTCSPAVPSSYATGMLKNLTIYGSKFSRWAFSVMFPSDYLAENVSMYGGATGCFYTVNGVQVTWTHMTCLRDLYYSHGVPANGMYFDGSGAGQGMIPTKIQSPWVSDATGTAMVFNWVSAATVSDAQITYNNKSLNIMNTSGGMTFTSDLFEAGATADLISGNGTTFIGGLFSGTGGVSVSGPANTFKNVQFAGSQTLTITGEGNAFEGTQFPGGLAIVDSAKTTSYENLWDYNSASPKYNFPTSQQGTHVYSGLIDPTIQVKGLWNLTSINTPYTIASTVLRVGQAWKAIFIGNWYYWGEATTMPTYVELTDAANTVTFSGQTLTFSISSGGLFQVQSSTGNGALGFSGFVTLVPRYASAGSGGTNSMQLSGNMQAPSLQVASGAAMTGNHGSGTRVQHSDGTGTTGSIATYAADGSVTAGPMPPTGAIVGTSDAQILTNKSINGSEVNSGTIAPAYGGTGQNESSATGIGQWNSGNYSVSTALASGTTAMTQSAGDNSTKVATTGYVASPGAITPTTITASGIVTGGNDTTRTTAASIGTTGFTTTGLVLPTVPPNTTKNGRCVVLWQMSTTSYTASFGMGMSAAPAGLWGGTSVTYGAVGTSNWLAFSQTATAATAVSTAVTAGTANTTYRAEIDFTLQTGSSNPVAVTLYGLVSQASATLTIEPGSACYWLP
jgi:hypothetical protein